ncbi:MAG: hypothetical protein U9O18_03195 [Chloroflexota bacterium]|nr:hypothetical protein [Chloroflexota bacterium]
MTVLIRASLVLLAVVVLIGCSVLEDTFVQTPSGTQPTADHFPDILALELRPQGDRVYDVAVTLSSPYDTPERYADGWRVLDPEGNVLGSHTLLHDHAAEQPFTRTQRGLHIPAGIDEITVEGRDQANGFGGSTLTTEVPE